MIETLKSTQEAETQPSLRSFTDSGISPVVQKMRPDILKKLITVIYLYPIMSISRSMFTALSPIFIHSWYSTEAVSVSKQLLSTLSAMRAQMLRWSIFVAGMSNNKFPSCLKLDRSSLVLLKMAEIPVTVQRGKDLIFLAVKRELSFSFLNDIVAFSNCFQTLYFVCQHARALL